MRKSITDNKLVKVTNIFRSFFQKSGGKLGFSLRAFEEAPNPMKALHINTHNLISPNEKYHQ